MSNIASNLAIISSDANALRIQKRESIMSTKRNPIPSPYVPKRLLPPLTTDRKHASSHPIKGGKSRRNVRKNNKSRKNRR